MTAPLRLRSKRNRVEKVPLPGEENAWAVVKDFGENREGYAAELKMARLLLAAGVPAAPILRAEEPVITYRWLEGVPLADLLGRAEEGPEGEALLHRAMEALCAWLEGYRAAAGGIILGDAHLRNFLLLEDGTVAGVDFECCRPGRPEEDAAKLAVFTAAYDPPWTPAKTRLAAFLLGKCQRRLGLDWGLLEEEMARELAAMGRRRGKEMDPALLGPVLELAKENHR